MKRYWQSYWETRSERDRRILIALAAVALAGLFYAYVWHPIAVERARLRATLPDLRGVALRMTEMGAEAARLKAALEAQGPGRDARAVFEQAAKRTGIERHVTRIAALGGERTEIALNTVPFADWLRFLDAVLAQPYVRVDTARVEATADPGIVRVQAVFATGSGI